MAEPTHIVVAGDWHGDELWATRVVRSLPHLLPNESPRIILQLGDFGFPPRTNRARRLSKALAEVDGQVWWVDGNHEHWDILMHPPQPWRTDDRGLKHVRNEPIFWATRGTRWTWHGRIWCAVGGAASPNRVHLTPMVDWWPEEELSGRQAMEIAAAGPVDVVVAHDCPDGIPLKLENPREYGWTDGDIANCERHRMLITELARELRPRWWMHGHYHQRHDTERNLGWGPVRVTGLDMNTFNSNIAVLDVSTMKIR